MKRETIGDMSGSVLGMMADLCHKLQHGARTPEQFEMFLKGKNPFTPETIIIGWQRFYKKFFNMRVNVRIPEKQSGFGRLILVPKGIMANQIFEVCQKNFSCWRYTEDLDEAIKGRNDRETTQDYAIWVRDTQEADEELKNLSADTLKEKNIKGITLLERLIFELKFWDETGRHLDEKNVTLCAGSRFSDGGVPHADWRDSEFAVDWYSPQDAGSNLRARAVVSALKGVFKLLLC